jgi:hypothetical protein
MEWLASSWEHYGVLKGDGSCSTRRIHSRRSRSGKSLVVARLPRDFNHDENIKKKQAR